MKRVEPTGEITRDSGTITLRPIRTKFGIIRLARSHHRKNSCFEKPRYYFVTIYQIDHGSLDRTDLPVGNFKLNARSERWSTVYNIFSWTALL